jgi:hypothetical protein
MQLVINHLTTAQSASALPAGTSIASPTRPASGHLGHLMLRPVAMRGCLHMLLPVCLAPGGGSAVVTPASDAVGTQPRACVSDKPHAEFLQQLLADGRADSDKCAASGTTQHSTQLYLQIDDREPQLVIKKQDGTWSLGGSIADMAAGSSSTAFDSGIDGSKGSSRGCWLEPSCVLLRPAGSASPSTSCSGASGSTDRPVVVVKGLPAAATNLVRVLLIQGVTVVTDQLLPATSSGNDAGCAASTRVVRRVLSCPCRKQRLMLLPKHVAALAAPLMVAPVHRLRCLHRCSDITDNLSAAMHRLSPCVGSLYLLLGSSAALPCCVFCPLPAASLQQPQHQPESHQQ